MKKHVPLAPLKKAAAITSKPKAPTKPSPPKPIKVGRPSSFDQSVADEICRRLAVREPLHQICADPRMPAESTVYLWRQEYPEFSDQYARAREARAESRADRIDQYVEDVRAGVLDPHQARVCIDAEKWQASKEQPRRFGDKVELNHSVSFSQEFEAFIRKLQSEKPAKVIDVTPARGE